MTGYPKTFIPLYIQKSRDAFCPVKTYSLKRYRQRSFHGWSPQNFYPSAYSKIQSSLLFRKDLFFKKKQAKKFSRLVTSKPLFSAYSKIQRDLLFHKNLFFEKIQAKKFSRLAAPQVFIFCISNFPLFSRQKNGGNPPFFLIYSFIHSSAGSHRE